MLRPIVIIAVVAKLAALGSWWAGYPIAATVLFFAPDPFVLYALLVPSAQALCRVYTHFTPDRPSVWLTIDDGPDETDTPLILDLLDRHQARATFFVIGERAARWPQLVREIVRRGHEIGHHTHTHPASTFWCASPWRLQRELDETLDVLRGLGVRPQRFRAPVGIKHLLLAPALAARGLSYVGWSIRSGDCRGSSPEEVVARLRPKLRSGVIVLLHEGPSVPAAVRVRCISLVLDEIARRKLTCVIPKIGQLC